MSKIFVKMAALAVASAGLIFASCDNNENSPEESTPATDIPSDDLAGPNPTIEGSYTATMPNIQVGINKENGVSVARIDMTGVQDKSTGEWIRLYGTSERDQNIWVELDGHPKGIKVYNTADDGDKHIVPIDMVFLVDNSSSMSEEADAVARDIIAWSTILENSGLNIRFGCVGYDGAITGAMNLTDTESLSEWLNRSRGTNRTVGFGGEDAELLRENTSYYRTGGGDAYECGVAALRFANDNFTFRNNANRIYINFTDEPNQPNGNPQFSVNWIRDNWETWMGTVHTVYSDYSENYTMNANSREYNYLMSEYTGGTVLNTNPSFTSVTLMDLPVSDAMQNSYIIRFTNIDNTLDGMSHDIRVTIMSQDGSVRVERTFNVVLGE